MYRRNYKRFSFLISFVVAILLLASFSCSAEKPVKNVIFLMTDGTASTHITLARWFKSGPLALDEILVGGIRTYSAESLITDSAPAATAFATGYKTNSKFLAILPETVSVPGVAPINEKFKYKPVATVLEGAKLKGKSVGLIATSNIQHASPAAFSSHTPYRDQYNQIAKQQVYENIDVVFSAGKRYLLPAEAGGARSDNNNLVEVLINRGYAFVETQEQMANVKQGKVWGLFADEAMQNDMDRKVLAPQEPSLAEMTKKAIELLSKNEKGFFLFVEASKVDWASHANEPMGVISDLLAYDEAVKVALNFAKQNGNTLVLACADHGNAGMSIGSKEVAGFYDKMSYDRLITPLKKADMTGEGIAEVIGSDRSEFSIRQIMARHYGIEDLSSEEVAKIQKAGKGRALAAVIGPMLSHRSAIGWIYGGHTGEDLFLYAYGPNKPAGLIENTQIAQIIAKALGFDLASVDQELFINAEEAFKGLGMQTEIDVSHSQQPVLIVKKGIWHAEMPIDTNILTIGHAKHALPGLIVYIPQTQKAYIPKAAVEIVRAAGF